MQRMNIIFVFVVVVILAWIVISYNGFVQLINRADEAWSDIDVQLKRRWDLIPNLVNTVKTYAKHEKTVFEEVTNARVKAMGAQSVHDKDVADGVVKDSIGKLLAIAENYPQLQASSDFVKLQEELTDTEDTIASARKYYNGTVRNLNIKIHSFPDMLIASAAGFKEREFFEADEEEREPIHLSSPT